MPLNALSAEKVAYKGVMGVWFTEDAATRMLQDLEEFNQLKNLKIPQLELKLDKQNYMLELYKQEVEVNAKLLGVWQENFKTSEELRLAETSALRKSLDKKTAWFRSPALYLSLGILLGGAMAVGLSFGLQEARN